MTDEDATSPDRIRLDQWLSNHGPLSAAAALVLILDACAATSRLDERTRGAVIGSLNAAGIIRHPKGWRWVPSRGSSEPHRTRDCDVVERLGAILFVALSGDTRVDLLAGEAIWRTTLRSSRPDLPPAIVDLTLAALMARRRRTNLTLAAFARELRQALAVERPAQPRWRQLALATGGAMAVVLLAGVAAWSRGMTGDRVGANGLTREESIGQDITYEFATTYALINEHTMAVGTYQQWGQRWQARLVPDDPRLIWALAHQAWVRTLAADRLTAEQLLGDAPGWLSRELGSIHPYTRAARLALADTLAARGVTEQVDSLRRDADAAVRELYRGTKLPGLLSGIPAPPGVVAHVSPNSPEREGFRAVRIGEFIAPLTSIQRLIAGRNGWRLHVVADGPCRTSVVVGNVPRRVTVNAARGADHRWQIQLLGTKPALTADAGSADAARLSLAGDGRGNVLLDAGGKTWPLALDGDGPLPDPPYALTFEGTNPQAGGCAVVWLEMAFPYQPGAKLTTAVSP